MKPGGDAGIVSKAGMARRNIGGFWRGQESNTSPDLNVLRVDCLRDKVVLKEKVLEFEEMIEVGDVDEVRTDTPLPKEDIESIEHREGVLRFMSDEWVCMGVASSDERSQFEPTIQYNSTEIKLT